MSLVVLERIEKKVELFLSQSQCAFRKGRATLDAIWAHRWIAATATRYNVPVHILGSDASRAFDTISRSRLMEILENEDGLYLMMICS